MPVTVRLTRTEEEQLRKKCIDINKRLIAADKSPMRESELVHFILEKSIPSIKIARDGSIYIEETNT